MRFELMGCKWAACTAQPMISGELMVPDGRMTASTKWDEFHDAPRARMHSIKVEDSSYRGGWVPYPWDTNQWLMVEFDISMAIYAVQTKGRQDYPQWTSSYKLQYAEIAGQWETYQEPYGVADKIFFANNDMDTMATNYLAANVYNVKYVRINPQTWSGNGIGLRAEIFGCSSHNDGCIDVAVITGSNNRIANSALTASTSQDLTRTGPQRSRLNLIGDGNLFGGWVPAVIDFEQWIQADLGRTTMVMAVATQGREDDTMYVISYKLSSSEDGSTFTEYQVDMVTQVFEANWERYLVHKQYLPTALTARFVRLHPLTWNVSIALRWEIYSCAGWAAAADVGCYADTLDAPDLPGSNITAPPGGMTRDICIQFCGSQRYLYAGLQNGRDCRCGNTYGRHGTSDQCNKPCEGDPTGQTICGGLLANSILHTGIFSREQVIGCYADNPDRDLPYNFYRDEPPGGNTQQFCAMHCYDGGYLYAGAQNGVQCYCGNSYGRYGRSVSCNKTCTGDRTRQTMCGGDWSNTVMSTGLALDHPRCRDGWQSFGSKCYRFSNETVTWNQARAGCVAMGGILATVNSQQMNDFVTSAAAGMQHSMWIGMHCLRLNNYFEWISGEPVLFTNWNRREPNAFSADENCVEIYYWNGLWNDNPCGGTGGWSVHGYVCEHEKEEIPDRATPPPDSTCPMGWMGYRWKCYTVVGTLRYSWPMGKSSCEGLGGTLVRIEDGSEQAFLSSTFGLELTDRYWTDLSEQNGQFVYSNGDRPSFVHWGTNQPASVTGGGCVALNMAEHGLWSNLVCTTTNSIRTICEIPRTGQTRPPSTAPTPPSGDMCYPGWSLMVDFRSCFQVQAPATNMRMTWLDAFVDCRSVGADLISIHSAEENSQLLGLTVSVSGNLWVGLNARDGSAGYVWSDGTPVDYEAWSNNPPDPQASCVDFEASTGKWNKIACDSRRNWICKIPRGVRPESPVTSTAPTAGLPGSCSPDNDEWKFFQNRCYFVTGTSLPPVTSDKSELDWAGAEDRCRQYGGNLVSIRSNDEQLFVQGLIRQLNIEAFRMWIGYSSANSDGSWQWADGSLVEFDKWMPGKPGGPDALQLCASMELINSDDYGKWSDQHCQTKMPFVCVKDKGGVTITTPIPVPLPGFCPMGYVNYENKCFLFVDGQLNWNESQQECLRLVGPQFPQTGLASIWDPWEQAFLTSSVRSLKSTRYWIGLYHFQTGQAQFGWVDNAALRFTNWAPGEPNGGLNEPCGEMYAEHRAGLWNDVACSTRQSYMCMRMKDPSITTPPTSPLNPCPTGYTVWEGDCYKVDTMLRTWQSAEAECVRDGAHLSDVTDLTEQGHLTLLLKNVPTGLWIGLSDIQNSGRYSWTDGTAVVFTHWAPSNPSISSGGCVRLDHTTYGRWEDVLCDRTYGSICKITVVPLPSTRPPVTTSCASGGVTDPWYQWGSNCYMVRLGVADRTSAATASMRCQQAGAQLASIQSDAENGFILSITQVAGVRSTWIGLMRTVDGGFMWSDGSSTGYFTWDNNQPNNNECTEMGIANGKWTSQPCGNAFGYTCKKRQVGAIDDTTLPTVASSTAAGQTTLLTSPTTFRSTTTAIYRGGSCPASWAAFGNYCYIFTPTQWDYEMARTMCQNRGADLASFTSPEERDFVFSLIEPMRQTMWMGARRQDSKWIWSDGTVPGPDDDDTVKNWDLGSGCPGSCVGDCVQMNHWNGLWTNVGCDWSMRGICKRRNDVADLCDFDNGWAPYGTLCYKYSTAKMTWYDAQAHCAASKGTLALIYTPERWNNMEDIVSCKDFQAGIWIGLSDTANKEMEWIDGTPLRLHNWDTNQPQNATVPGGNCVKSMPVSHYKWRVDLCDKENEFLCEKEPGTCADGWLDWGTGFCYLLVGQNELHRRSWSDAELYCSSTGLGGHLISAHGDRQQQAMSELSKMFEGVERVRIGLSDVVNDNIFLWADNSSVIYDNTGVIEAIPRRVDCGFVSIYDSAAKWNTGYCFDSLPFICQLPIHRTAVLPAEPGGYLCPDGWETDHSDGKCYQFSEVAVTYSEAKVTCSNSGKLLTLLSPAQQSFVTSRLRGPTWLGLEYRGNGLYEWHDQSPLRFENWRPNGMSVAPGSRCTSLSNGNPRGEWIDDDCSEKRMFICFQIATHSTATTPVPSPTVPWHPECGPGWSYDFYGQKCYRLVNEMLTFEDAEVGCQKIGSHLASIHSPQEMNYINALVAQNVGWMNFWIGGNDIDQTKGWQWTDGSPFYFWNWNDGEPNNAGGREFCIEMSGDMLGRWNDINCDREFRFICMKRSLSSTPPPGFQPTMPPANCDNPLPLVSGRHYVRNYGLRASTSQPGRDQIQGRIFPGSLLSWSAADGDADPWLGVFFTHYVIVAGVTTMGAADRAESDQLPDSVRASGGKFLRVLQTVER